MYNTVIATLERLCGKKSKEEVKKEILRTKYILRNLSTATFTANATVLSNFAKRGSSERNQPSFHPCTEVLLKRPETSLLQRLSATPRHQDCIVLHFRIDVLVTCASLAF